MSRSVLLQFIARTAGLANGAAVGLCLGRGRYVPTAIYTLLGIALALTGLQLQLGGGR